MGSLGAVGPRSEGGGRRSGAVPADLAALSALPVAEPIRQLQEPASVAGLVMACRKCRPRHVTGGGARDTYRV